MFDDHLNILLLTTVLVSVIGAISIPGMMTGAIFGGVSVEQAALLQMVLMFMIVASTALAAILATYLTLAVVIDNEHRLRTDLVILKQHVVWRIRDRCGDFVVAIFWSSYRVLRGLGKSGSQRGQNINRDRDYELLG